MVLYIGATKAGFIRLVEAKRLQASFEVPPPPRARTMFRRLSFGTCCLDWRSDDKEYRATIMTEGGEAVLAFCRMEDGRTIARDTIRLTHVELKRRRMVEAMG